MPDRGRDHEWIRNVGETAGEAERRVNPTPPGAGEPIDAGRTSGGGSLGHDQPADVTEQTHLRNEGSPRERDVRDRGLQK